MIEKHITDLLMQKDVESKAYELYLLCNFLSNVEDERDVDTKQRVLDEWCAVKSESYIPFLLRGCFYVEYAWYIRGGGYADTVSEDAMSGFESKLLLAKDDLEKSFKLNPNDPNSSCDLITVAMGLNYSEEQMEQYYGNAISACSNHFGAALRKFNYLTPKWHGSPSKMIEFATQCASQADKYPYMGFLMVYALNEIHDVAKEKTNFLGQDDIWPTVEKVYDNFFAKYPNNIQRRFFFARHAFLAKKYDIAIKQFELIGDQWMEETSWSSLKKYNRCRAITYNEYALTLEPKQALQFIRKSVELDPTRRFAYYSIGSFKLKMGKDKEAEKALSKAIEIDPCHVNTLLLLSYLYFYKGSNLTEAIRCAEKALNCNPNDEQKALANQYVQYIHCKN